MSFIRLYSDTKLHTLSCKHYEYVLTLVSPCQITPSEYEREMKMSTQQRLQNLNNIEVDNLLRASNKEANKPVLSFTPRLIVFQNFKPNDKIVAKFSVKNISKVTTTFLSYLNFLNCFTFFILHGFSCVRAGADVS